MGFLGVYRAIYDYTPAGEGELEIADGDLLLVLEKSTEDDWWRVKKKATSEEEDEPEGLVPSNYVEEAQSISRAKAIFDYSQQTDEEISFSEDAQLDVYDSSDPEWTLVGHNGEFGFAPSNYIELTTSSADTAAVVPAVPTPPTASRGAPASEINSAASMPPQNPAKALAGIIAQRTGDRIVASTAAPIQTIIPARYTPAGSDEETAPTIPHRTSSQAHSPTAKRSFAPAPVRTGESSGVVASPPYNRAVSNGYDEQVPATPGGYKLYAIHEMVSSMGKNKKMPITLGLDLACGMIMLAPAKSKDGAQQEWTADRMTHYSIEGKHVFLELVRPSKSADFHAGAKDTAQEIVAQLGELAGASRAEGLKEVIAASSGAPAGQKKGHMLYEFMAQGDDEVTVAVGDEIVVLDDTRSEEWWMVRRLKNGKEGVVPASYVEITGTLPVRETTSAASFNASRSVVEQNRLEEARATKEAHRRHKKQESEERRRDDGNGLRLPARESSLVRKDGEKKSSSQKKKRDDAPKTKPNLSRVRTWTDRSGTFRVEAEFLGLKENKIHLHKDNGVKIAVPVGKMAIEDLEYVEKITGVSLDDEKPLSDIKRRSTLREKDRQAKAASNGASASTEYDWFDFFLACGVNPQICERYAQAFSKDQMGEETLPDVTAALLRTLGFKEGDILRVMKHLDNKFGRNNSTPVEGDGSASGGLFSGPGGALRNNTRKGRPAPAVETNDCISAESLRVKTGNATETSQATISPSGTADASGLSSQSQAQQGKQSGFDDDAWSVKPSKSPVPAPASEPPKTASPAPAVSATTEASSAPATAQAPNLTGSMGDLSLLTPALEPTPTPAIQPQQTAAVHVPPPPPPIEPAARPLADAAFFDKLGAPATQNILAQPTGRQRPNAPAVGSIGNGSLISPPPRSASAPGYPQQQQLQMQQSSVFAAPSPLSIQMTGYQQPMQASYQAPPVQSLATLQQQQQQQQQQQPQQPLVMSETMLPPQQMPYIRNGMLPSQQTGYQNMVQVPAQMTGFYPLQQQQQLQDQQQHQQFSPLQPQLTSSPFADPPRPPFQPSPTGFNPNGYQSIGGARGGGLPPALTPMRTGFGNNNGGMLQQQQTGFGQQAGRGYMPQQQQQQQPQQVPSQMLPPQQLPPGMMQPNGGGINANNGNNNNHNNYDHGANGIVGGSGVGQQQQQAMMAPLMAQRTGPAPPVRFGVQQGLKPLVATPTGRRANLSNATPQNPFGF